MKSLALRSLLRSLIVSFLCVALILFDVFFPYLYHSSPRAGPASNFDVGICYVYESDPVELIYGEVGHIQSVGFRILRINLRCDAINPNAYVNNQTDALFGAASHFGLPVALIIMNHQTLPDLQYYLGRWGRNLSYIQIMNEPELSQSWDLGTLFTDDEIITQFQQYYSVIEPFNLSAKLYTNFESGYILRSNIPIVLSKNLDFVGFDIYMQSFLTLSPNFVQSLRQTTGKDVIVTEFGMSTADDVAQSNFLIQGLNLFKNMGIQGCWLVYWNSDGTYYGIRGRLAEQKVGEWIANNT